MSTHNICFCWGDSNNTYNIHFYGEIMKIISKLSSDTLLICSTEWLVFIPVLDALLQPCSNEPPHDKTNNMVCAPSEDSDQPGHLPSLIRVFAVRSVGSWGPNVSSCGQRRLWSDWADAQADLSLRWAQRSFCWFCHEAAQILGSLQQLFQVFQYFFYST